MSNAMWRPSLRLEADDQEMWELMKKRLDQGKSFEDIAYEIGANVDELLHWANWVYKPRKKQAVKPKKYVSDIAVSAKTYPDMPALSPTASAAKFAAWRKATQGARETRLMNAAEKG